MGKTRRATLAQRTLGVLLSLVVAAGIALVGAAPAQAQANPFFNGFEGNDAFVWTFSASGPGNSAFVERNSPRPRSGVNNGALLANDGGSAAVSRSLNLSGWRSCRATAYVQTNGGAIVVGVENAATGQTHLTETYLLNSTGSQYVELSNPSSFSVSQSAPEVIFRVILVAPSGRSSWARVDDTALHCSR